MRNPIFYKKLDDESRNLLTRHFKFYKNLTAKQQRLFEHRVVIFIMHHKFIGKAGFQINKTMVLLIAGTAIMLSFGFNHYLYNLFDTILIYPHHYFSNQTQLEHKGEANPTMGIIVFSWKDFQEGLAIEHDNLQLGLHEFAHALQFSFIKDHSNEAQRFKKQFKRLLHQLTLSETKEKLINSNYLRTYAFENQYEFFAVMVEHFFESPDAFKVNLPELFYQMSELLRIETYLKC